MFKTFLNNEDYRLPKTTKERARLLLRIYTKPCRVYESNTGEIAIYDGFKYFLVDKREYIESIDTTYNEISLTPAEDCEVLQGYVGESACFVLSLCKFVVDRKCIIPCYSPNYNALDCIGCNYEQSGNIIQITATDGLQYYSIEVIGSEINFERIYQNIA